MLSTASSNTISHQLLPLSSSQATSLQIPFFLTYPSPPPIVLGPPLGLRPGFPVWILPQRSLSTPKTDSMPVPTSRTCLWLAESQNRVLSLTIVHTRQSFGPTHLPDLITPHLFCAMAALFDPPPLGLSMCFDHAWNECSPYLVKLHHPLTDAGLKALPVSLGPFYPSHTDD